MGRPGPASLLAGLAISGQRRGRRTAMTTPHLHVLAIDPGGSTGWCLLTVPRLCIFGPDPSEILERDYGEFHGAEEAQATEIARLAREIQGLDYKTGPA